MNRTERRHAVATAAAEVSFYCDQCGELISPQRDSAAFASYCHGELSREDVIELLRGAHARHEHSRYDEIRLARVAKLRGAGDSWEAAHFLARRYAREVVKYV